MTYRTTADWAANASAGNDWLPSVREAEKSFPATKVQIASRGDRICFTWFDVGFACYVEVVMANFQERLPLTFRVFEGHDGDHQHLETLLNAHAKKVTGRTLSGLSQSVSTEHGVDKIVRAILSFAARFPDHTPL